MVNRITLVLLCLIWGTADAQIYYNLTPVPPSLPVFYSDNYATLQALSDAVPSSGGTMVISSGNYIISTVITLKSHTIVQCLPGATLTAANGGAALFEHWLFVNQHHDEAAGVITDTDIHIRGCGFDGGTATPSTGLDGVRFVWASDVEVSDSTFNHFGSGTAFLATVRSLVANNKAIGINDGCYNGWHAPSYMIFIDNYCETTKHGYEITGTDTAQTSAGIASHITIINPEVVLFSSGAIGAGIWFNSGAFTDTGAGVTDGTIIGGHISTSGLGSSVGDCVDISGRGDTNDWIIGTHCDNAYIYVGPADVAVSYPSNNHVRNVSVNITNTYAGAAIQIKTGTSGVESSRVTGGGYAYGIDLIGATNQYAKNNSIVSGTDGTYPRIRTDGTSAATALVVDTDETGASPTTIDNTARTETAANFNSVSFRSPSFFVGTASNGSLQYAGSHKIVLDADDAGTGLLAIRTDAGAGAVDRLTVANDGSVSVAGSFTADTLIGTTSSKSPQFIIGSTGAGLLQTSATKVVLDATGNGTGTTCLRTDSGTGLQDRFCILNDGSARNVPTTVGALPAAAAGNKGARAFVTDATATTFASIVAGGGANNVPVYSDGTNWRIG